MLGMHLHFSAGTSYLFRKKINFPYLTVFGSELPFLKDACTTHQVGNSMEIGCPYRAGLDVYLNHHKQGES